MAYLPIRKVLGTNRKWDADQRRWVDGKCWLVVLEDWPYRIYRVPKFSVLSECQAGDEDQLLEVMDWMAREIEQKEWVANMNKE